MTLGRRWLVVICLLAFPGPARPQTLLEKLIFPGPLVEGHAKLESNCGNCHQSSSRQSQPRLCLDCHKEIAFDRDSKVRFHGRQPDALNQQCSHCHLDHKGRDADIVQLDRDTFDHDLTGYPLMDAHKTVRCDGCHVQKVPFQRTSSVCFDCHKKVHHHSGKLGERCEGCHSPTKWRQTRTFDHSETKFPLEGAHKTVLCETCHIGEIYEDLAATCGSCHRLQDVHADRYGPKCETCHDQLKWKNARFDHDKTKFPLHGAHANVKCDACHTGNLYRDKLETTCVSCHQKQDPHKGQLGPRCEQCHNDANWRKDIKFNHNQTNFPLVGLHAPVPCAKCHQSLTYKDAPTACEKCHQDTRHQGRLGSTPRCAACHTPNGWARWYFDHARQAKYPLTGAHAKLQCEGCHSIRNAGLNLPTVCEKCHADYHRGHLGAPPNCETCHTTSAWPQWRFDHGRQANYPLIGAHAKIKCETCHTATNAATLKLASDCFSCHRKDDAHTGSFGRMCDRCHTPISWNRVDIRN